MKRKYHVAGLGDNYDRIFGKKDKCGICGKEMDTGKDLDRNCGGDCWECVKTFEESDDEKNKNGN